MLGEGTKTSQTKSDKFEVQIKDNLERFLSSQDEPLKSLEVSRYDGTDTKFYSDIKIENPRNGRNIWIEVKLNKYANLGGPSFKYRDGKWTCTTTDDEDHLTGLYLEALEKGSGRFIEFCKSYLKTDDISIPKDLSPELIDAWKDSGSVQDTDNDVQFITDKIPLEDFGRKIAEYYKIAKYEPVYYIQVDDDLYIVDPNYNPLGLATRDGAPLKPLSEAYRIGRIQFRAKGIDKKLKDGDKYYYSIVCDVKILADDERKDEPEYVCSLKTEEKYPIVQSQQPLNEAQDDKFDGFREMKESEVRHLARGVKFRNDEDRKNLEKYYGGDYRYFGMFDHGAFAAVAVVGVLDKSEPKLKQVMFLHQLNSFIKGFGKKLLLDIFGQFDKVAFGANPDADKKLLDYYRDPDFNLVEYTVEKSAYGGKPLHLFYTRSCDRNEMEKLFKSWYSDDGKNEKSEDELEIKEALDEIYEAEADIGGEPLEELPETGVKVWIDDVREPPEGFKWFRTVDDFIDWCHARGHVDDVALFDTDHDAAECEPFGGNYVRCFEYLDACGCDDVTVHIHSSNPMGANAIRSIISKNKERGWKELKNS